MHAMQCRCPACAGTARQPIQAGAPRPAAGNLATRVPASGVRAPTSTAGGAAQASGRWVRRGRTIILLDL